MTTEKINIRYERTKRPAEFESVKACLEVCETVPNEINDDAKLAVFVMGKFNYIANLTDDVLNGRMTTERFKEQGGTVETKPSTVQTNIPIAAPSPPQIYPPKEPEGMECPRCKRYLKGKQSKYAPFAMRYWCMECKKEAREK